MTTIELTGARPFTVDELFFSTTDQRGIITASNEVFTRVSAFSPAELLGQPHNLVRHHDMPRCVFKLLWDYLLAGKPIGAYVKNRAKTGEYYWVFALAAPITGGFLSIRVKPGPQLLPVVEKLYRELLQIESTHGSKRRDGLEESSSALLRAITDLGFESYDSFMSHALYQEVINRDLAMAGSKGEGKGLKLTNIPESSFIGQLDGIFASLANLLKLRDALKDQRTFFLELGRDITLTSLNAGVSASRLADSGRALAVISGEVSNVAKQILSESDSLTRSLHSLSQALQEASFSICMAKLQVEMMAFFTTEQAAHALSEEEQRATYGASVDDLKAILFKCASDSGHRAQGCIQSLSRALKNFLLISESLTKILVTIQFSYVTGRTLSAGISSAAQFSALLEKMVRVSDEARSKLSTLETSTQGLMKAVDGWAIA